MEKNEWSKEIDRKTKTPTIDAYPRWQKKKDVFEKKSSCRNKDASIRFFFEDGTDDFGDGNDKRSPKIPMY